MSYYDYYERYKDIEDKVWKERIKRVNKRLTPCSCCGGRAEVKKSTRPDGYCSYSVVYVECNRCGLRTKDLDVDGYYDGERHTPEEAAELWNRRYSGINDRNGKTICHGDHIRIVGKNWSDGMQGEYEVRYSDITFEWYLRKVDYNPFDYSFARGISFSDLNIEQFTDEIELVRKED